MLLLPLRTPPSAAPARVAKLLRRAVTLSAVDGPTHPPLVQHTFPEYFATEVLAKHASRPALISRSERPRPHGGPFPRNMLVESHLAWDFEEFDAHIQALARGLLDMGVEKGDRVGVVMGNNRCVRPPAPASSLTILPSCCTARMQCYNGLARALVLSW